MADQTSLIVKLARAARKGGQLQVSYSGSPRGASLPLYVGVGDPANKKMLNGGQPVPLIHSYSCALDDADLQGADEVVVSAVIVLQQPADATGELVVSGTLQLAGAQYPLQQTFQLRSGETAGWIEFAWWLEAA